MTWLLWVGAYLGVAALVGLLYGRHEVKALIADPSKFKYEKTEGNNSWSEPRNRERTEVERVQRCAESVFWESWWTGIAWPLALAAALVMSAYDGITYILVGSELKKARTLDEEKKAKKILKEWEAEQKKKFDGL